MIGRRLTVTGRVQGVSFRFFTQQAAVELGLSGWVRNRPDGSVEIEVWGECTRVRQLVDRVAEGPRHGRVDSVEVEELPGEAPATAGFQVRATS